MTTPTTADTRFLKWREQRRGYHSEKRCHVSALVRKENLEKTVCKEETVRDELRNKEGVGWGWILRKYSEDTFHLQLGLLVRNTMERQVTYRAEVVEQETASWERLLEIEAESCVTLAHLVDPEEEEELKRIKIHEHRAIWLAGMAGCFEVRTSSMLCARFAPAPQRPPTPSSTRSNGSLLTQASSSSTSSFTITRQFPKLLRLEAESRRTIYQVEESSLATFVTQLETSLLKHYRRRSTLLVLEERRERQLLFNESKSESLTAFASFKAGKQVITRVRQLTKQILNDLLPIETTEREALFHEERISRMGLMESQLYGKITILQTTSYLNVIACDGIIHEENYTRYNLGHEYTWAVGILESEKAVLDICLNESRARIDVKYDEKAMRDTFVKNKSSPLPVVSDLHAFYEAVLQLESDCEAETGRIHRLEARCRATLQRPQNVALLPAPASSKQVHLLIEDEAVGRVVITEDAEEALLLLSRKRDLSCPSLEPRQPAVPAPYPDVFRSVTMRILASTGCERDEVNPMRWKGKSKICLYNFCEEAKKLSLVTETAAGCNAMWAAEQEGSIYLTDAGDDEHPQGVRLVKLENDTFSADDEVIKTGQGPCHIAVTSGGTEVLVSEYEGGVVTYDVAKKSETRRAVLSKEGTTPGVGRQDASHPHSAMPLAIGDKQHYIGCDLGSDKVVLLNSALEEVTCVTLKANTGPRHCAVSESKGVAYVVGELDNTVTTLALPSLEVLDVCLCIPEDYSKDPPFPFYTAPSHAAGIKLSHDGTRLFVTNRGHDSFTCFDTTNTKPSNPTHTPSGGRLPWELTLHGKYVVVANQFGETLVSEGNVTVFELQDNGSAQLLDSKPLHHALFVKILR